jgi:hypothetical protein
MYLCPSVFSRLALRQLGVRQLTLNQLTLDWLTLGQLTPDWLALSQLTPDWLALSQLTLDRRALGQLTLDWLALGQLTLDWLALGHFNNELPVLGVRLSSLRNRQVNFLSLFRPVVWYVVGMVQYGRFSWIRNLSFQNCLIFEQVQKKSEAIDKELRYSMYFLRPKLVSV